MIKVKSDYALARHRVRTYRTSHLAPPKGGAAQVLAPIGSSDCWCGGALCWADGAGSHWFGKEQGLPHPREGNKEAEAFAERGREMAKQSANERLVHLGRDQLRKWDDDVAAVLMEIVNTCGATYRMDVDGNHLYLYSGGSGRPFRAAAKRPKAAQLKYLEKFIKDHGLRRETIVSEDPAVALAQKFNDPVEHPPKESPVKETVEVVYEPVEEESTQRVEPIGKTQANMDSSIEWDGVTWYEHVTLRGHKPTGFYTDGWHFLCQRCLAEGKPRRLGGDGSARGVVGGHFRASHRPRSQSSKAPKETTEHRAERYKRWKETTAPKKKAQRHLEALAEMLEVPLGEEAAKWQARAEKAEAKVSELEAKLALVKEAMRL